SFSFMRGPFPRQQPIADKIMPSAVEVPVFAQHAFANKAESLVHLRRSRVEIQHLAADLMQAKRGETVFQRLGPHRPSGALRRAGRGVKTPFGYSGRKVNFEIHMAQWLAIHFED